MELSRWPVAGPRRPAGAPAVWAPRAEHVEVLLEASGVRLGLEWAEGGWFATDHVLAPGTDHWFVLDHGSPLADPRSRWQPGGVFGPSRSWEPGAFDWTDSRWRGPSRAGAVIYELHVGTFSAAGTFDGAIGHLDHLAELGVTLVEVMPVAEFPGSRGWGYDGVLLFAPHHGYGGPDGLDRFVDAAHARGIGVLLDVVYNHLGPEGNHLARFGPYFSDRHHTPWGAAINLDGPESPEVRRFLIDNAVHWLADHHLDGLRLDAVHALVDTSALTFLEDLSMEVDRLAAHVGRTLLLVAESDANDPSLSTPREAGGTGLDAQWNDDLHHALHVSLTSERTGYYADFDGLGDLARCYRDGFVRAGQVSRHAAARRGRLLRYRDGGRLVAFSQNHDQIGNRAAGERLGQLVGVEAGLVAAAVVLFAPFVPMLFQGEEWAASATFPYFAGFTDTALVQSVRDGRRREFADAGWSAAAPDPFAASTFDQARLDWAERSDGAHARTLGWYRQLLELRAGWPELTDGRLDLVEVDVVAEQGLFIARRGRLQLVAAVGSGAARVAVPTGAAVLLASSGAVVDADGVLLVHGPAAVVVLVA